MVASYPERSGRVRIISAREATKHERKIYQEEADVPSRDTLPQEYRRKGFGKGVRGKYLKKYTSGTNLVLLSPDLAKAFPTSESVNSALRSLLQVAHRVIDRDKVADHKATR